MVKGLATFKEHFAPYRDKYMLIGGTACMLVMEEAGLDFRATKDLDIVLLVEALNNEFVSAFWEFIKLGGYQNRQKSTGKQIFYRFDTPNNKDFPAMLELFSRIPDNVNLDIGGHLTPIPLNEAATSLSAILLDESYYHFIHSVKREKNGLPVVGVEGLIPLKAKAWLELNAMKNANEAIDEKNIRKHKYDVFRLYQLLSSNEQISLPLSIKNDLRNFITHIEKDNPVDLKNLGLKNMIYEEVLRNLKTIYKIFSINSLGEILTKRRGDELIQMVNEALASGADVNDSSLNDHHPLQLLIKASLDDHAKLELAKKFIALGADINSKDKSGLTPYQVAVSMGNKNISDLLRSKGARPMSPPGTGYAQHHNMYGEIP